MLKNRRISLLLTVLLTGFTSVSLTRNEAQAQSDGPQYEVDLSQSITHYVTVTMKAEATGPETIIMMPTWTPGSYLVREYARHIDQISAVDSRGRPLELVKISKNRWRIKTGEAKRFQVKYRLFCNEASVRTNMVDVNFAVLNGAATFVTIPEQLPRTHTVQLILPKRWERSATSMPAGKKDHEYVAADFDELVDSPIVAGNVISYPFEVAGVPHYLVNVNQEANWDAETAVRDLGKVVAEHHRVWGVVPYDRYYFINVFGAGGGGLEHNNCCLMMTSRFDVRDEARFQRWLSLASHEFFHAWNIRRLRPKSLVNYDYENEVYTPSLWIAEGITSYYEDLMLVRTGLVNEEDFLKGLGRTVNSLQQTPGRLMQSLRDSSHDAWIKFYRNSSNASDTQISYYTKGAVVGFLLDTKIRAASGGRQSLDDVLRVFWARHAGDVGYEPEDFRKLCSEAAGVDLEPWFHLAVDSTAELDYQEAADWYGLEIGTVKPRSEQVVEEVATESAADEDENDETTRPNRRAPRGRAWIGIGEFDSPATRAGVADSDEIIAINERRVGSSLDSELRKYEVGEPIKLLIARDGQLQEILVVVGARPETTTWSIKLVRQPTEAQTSHRKAWMTNEIQGMVESEETESVENMSDVESGSEAEATTEDQASDGG